jgi:tRNA uracil 4-sulfurtransferase
VIEFVIRIGELSLKGENRDWFDRKLIRNLRRSLKGTPCSITHRENRFYLEVSDDHAMIAQRKLERTFGIVAFARVYRVRKSIDRIIEAALEVASAAGAAERPQTFKVSSRRSDKSFPLSSHEIETAVGDSLRSAFPLLSVHLDSPDLLVRVEVRERASVFGNDRPGPSGLPVETSGRGMLLLSGGIDSPVAGYLMAKRGMKLDSIYFDSFPYSPREAHEKAEDLSALLATYNVGMTLFTVPFADIAVTIRERAKSEYVTILMRASMMEIATRIAASRRAVAIVTGDSLGQVASQTAENIGFVDRYAGVPVFRPLLGYDKLETISLARNIGSYDISVRPYDDCCTVFAPRAPIIRSDLEAACREYDRIDIAEFIEPAVRRAEMRWSDP